MASLLKRHALRPAAWLAAIALCAGVEAEAAFTYSTAPTPFATSLAGSTIGLLGVSSATTLIVPTRIDIALVQYYAVALPPPVTFTINFSDAITVSNVPPPGTAASGTINVTGLLDFFLFTSSGTPSELSTLTPSASSSSGTIGGVTYSLSNFTYTAPTANSTNGKISALITPSVPAPASIVSMGLGLAGVGFVAVRRRSAR